MFQHAIVRIPARTVCDGITMSPELGKPVYEKAMEQHAAYIEALKSCDVDVTVLPADDNFPDSCFVEDVAVVTKKCAVITNPGASTRNHEIDSIRPVLEKFYSPDCIERITAPGTLEGGDVMMVGDTFYVGLSKRTNKEGVEQFRTILGKYGYKVIGVPMEKILHLKTGVVYLENNLMLVSGEFIGREEFASYKQILVPEDEAYAANCVWMNGKVIVPAGYPKMLAAVQSAGYPTVVVDTSEFRKIDGGLSCLSLRF